MRKVLAVMVLGIVSTAFSATVSAQQDERPAKRKAGAAATVQTREAGGDSFFDVIVWAEKAAKSPGYRPARATAKVAIRKEEGRADAKAGTTLADSRKAQSLVAQGRRLNEEILRNRARMTAEQAEAYERKMRDLVTKMDQVAKCGSDVGSEGPAQCMCNCDKAYPGWGGGNGWNRFWCKAACIKVKVGKGGASVGD